MVMGFLRLAALRSDGAEHSLLRAVAAAILMAVALFGLIVPSLQSAVPERDAGAASCATAAARSRSPPPPAISEPSLVFLAGTATRLTDGAGAADFLRGGECRFALIEARQERSFAQRAEAIGLRYSAGPRIEAINIGTAGRSPSRSIRSAGRHERQRRPRQASAVRRVARMGARQRRRDTRPARSQAAIRCTMPWLAPLRVVGGATAAIAALGAIMALIDARAIGLVPGMPAWLIAALTG